MHLGKSQFLGFYKKLVFRLVAPHNGKPVVLDDTCYFLPCRDEAIAATLVEMLDSEEASAFYNSLVFWDAKRPITAALLQSLDLRLLIESKGCKRATDFAEF